MPYTAEHKQATRERIVESARRLFNRRGFAQVSIDEIMEGAGLTRGGFYNHFQTKEDLYAEAVTQILQCNPAANTVDGQFEMSSVEPGLALRIVNAYLSREHYDDIDSLCPLVALPSDTARGGAGVKRAYETVLNSMIGLFSANLGQRTNRPRQRALAIATLCVGGMVLARAVETESLADEIRDASRALALECGGWD